MEGKEEGGWTKQKQKNKIKVMGWDGECEGDRQCVCSHLCFCRTTQQKSEEAQATVAAHIQTACKVSQT